MARIAPLGGPAAAVPLVPLPSFVQFSPSLSSEAPFLDGIRRGSPAARQEGQSDPASIGPEPAGFQGMVWALPPFHFQL